MISAFNGLACDEIAATDSWRSTTVFVLLRTKRSSNRSRSDSSSRRARTASGPPFAGMAAAILRGARRDGQPARARDPPPPRDGGGARRAAVPARRRSARGDPRRAQGVQVLRRAGSRLSGRAPAYMLDNSGAKLLIADAPNRNLARELCGRDRRDRLRRSRSATVRRPPRDSSIAGEPGAAPLHVRLDRPAQGRRSHHRNVLVDARNLANGWRVHRAGSVGC